MAKPTEPVVTSNPFIDKAIMRKQMEQVRAALNWLDEQIPALRQILRGYEAYLAVEEICQDYRPDPDGPDGGTCLNCQQPVTEHGSNPQPAAPWPLPWPVACPRCSRSGRCYYTDELPDMFTPWGYLCGSCMGEVEEKLDSGRYP